MLPEQNLEAITERDIDLLVCEELSVNPGFRARFLRQLQLDHEEAKKVRVLHSVTDPALGESDLVLLIQHQSHPHAVLSENKVDAPAQEEQAARYRQRGEQGKQSGTWSHYTTCIIAPERYLQSVKDTGLYQFSISYERLMEFLQASPDLSPERKSYRVALLKLAIEQNRRGYNPKTDERVTAFWRDYWTEATALFPELGLPEPGPKPAKATFVRFHPPLLNRSQILEHKLDHGNVDLTLQWPSSQLEECQQSLAAHLPENVELATPGKNCAARIKVPLLDPLKPYAEQRDHAIVGINAALQLIHLGQQLPKHSTP